MAKENGAQFHEQSDIDKLIEVLEKIEINTKHQTEGNLPDTPKYEDFVKNLGNLDLVVPMGFVMLHNDLEKLYKAYNSSDGKSTKSSSSFGFNFDVASSILAVGGAISLVTGTSIIGGLIKGMTLKDVLECLTGVGDWVISTLPEIGEFVTDFVANGLPVLAEAMSQSAEIIGSGAATTLMNVKDLLSDQELIKQRKSLLTTWLYLQYAQIYKHMGYTAKIDADGTILSVSEPEEKEDKDYSTEWEEGFGWENLKSIINDEFNVAKNVIINDFEDGSLGEKLGKSIGGYFASQVERWVALAEQEIPALSLTGLQTYSIFTDDDILSEIKKFSKSYVQAYYVGVLDNLGFDIDIETGTITRQETSKEDKEDKDVLANVDTSSAKSLIADTFVAVYNMALNDFEDGDFGTNVGKLIGGIYSGQIESWATAISDSITALAASITSFGMLGEEPSSKVKEAYGYYIQAYYASLISQMGYDIDFTNGRLKRALTFDKVMSIAKDIVGNILTSGVGVILESVSSSIGTTISTLAASITSFQMLGDGPSDKVKEVYSYYIQAYYAKMIAGLGYDIDFATGTLTRAISFESVRTTFSDTVGDVLAAVPKGFISGITSIVSSIQDSVQESDLKSELRETILGYVSSIYTEASGATEVVDAAKTFVQSYFEALNDDVIANKSKYSFSAQWQIGKLNQAVIDGVKETTAALNADLTTKVEVLSTYDDTKLRQSIQEIYDVIFETAVNILQLSTDVHVRVLPDMLEIKNNQSKPVVVNTPTTNTIDNSDLNVQ